MSDRSWGNATAMPGPLSFSQAFINVNRLYVIGGNSGTGLNVVYSTDIKEDGTLGIWTTEASFPVTIFSSSLTCIKNRVYLIGGYQSGVQSSNIYSASLNSDGSIGNWILSGNFPITIAIHQVITTRNYIYIVGGHNGSTPLSSIYKASIYDDGSIGTWSLQSWALPSTCYYSKIAMNCQHTV